MSDWTRYVVERGTDCYCPIESCGCVVTGMNYVGAPPEGARVIGEFWYDEDDGQICIRMPDSSDWPIGPCAHEQQF